MIIDGHAHACGDFCTARQLIDCLDKHAVDCVILVPGEPGSTRTYPLPELARFFPDRDVVPITNALSRMALRFTKTAETIGRVCVGCLLCRAAGCFHLYSNDAFL